MVSVCQLFVCVVSIKMVHSCCLLSEKRKKKASLMIQTSKSKMGKNTNV